MHSNACHRILVLGARGLLGSTLVPVLKSFGNEVISSSRFASGADVNFDPANFFQTSQILLEIKPDFVINLHGLTSVEECEINPELAFRANTLPNLNLCSARIANRMDFRIVSISTDHLYNRPGISKETEVEIVNTYALSKLEGELALDCNYDASLRTNFVGKSRTPTRESLTDWIVNNLMEGRSLKILDDVLFSPLSMLTLSELIGQVLSNFKPGTYNLGSKNGQSKAEFDIRFALELGLEAKHMSRVSLDEADFLVTKRPRDMRMNVEKFESEFSVKLPTLHDELCRVVKEYK
jgi:dTDP-4-dehydrorhamnose reductase